MKLMFCEAWRVARATSPPFVAQVQRLPGAMFKPVKQPSHKRSRHEDGSSSVVYKETPAERQARLREEKEAERELRAKKAKLGPSKASVLGLDPPEEEPPEPDVRKIRSHKEMKPLGWKITSIRANRQ